MGSSFQKQDTFNVQLNFTMIRSADYDPVQRPARLYRPGALERTVRLDVCSANLSIALSA